MWGLLLLALGPMWLELARHVRMHAWAAYVLVVPLLLIWGAAGSPRERTRPLLGAGLLVTALLAELAALLAGPLRAGRIALPLGVLGMSALAGRPPRRFWPLAPFLIPVPFAVLWLASPGLEGLWLRGGARLAQALGQAVSLSGARAVSPAGELGLSPGDDGLPLAALFTVLGCFAGAYRGRAPLAALLRGLLVAPLALPVQALAVAIGVPIATGGYAVAARAWLDHGLPLVCAAASLAVVARGAAGRKTRSPGVTLGAVG